MKILFGVLLATLILFVANILAWKMSIGFLGIDTVQNDKIIETSLITYLLSFVHSFIVIAGLTWMISQVMPLLDKYRKRVLFIFILGLIFSIYSRGVFYVLPWSWIFISIIWDSFIWLIISLVLAQFVRPKHLGSS